jgi:uncharacterized protein (DUF1697 family)
VAKYVALLRGINVGANARVPMAGLRDALTALGMSEPRSLLNSGNLVFGSDASVSALEVLLERDLEKRLGLRTAVFVRSARDWNQVVARNPFPAEAQNDPGHLIAMFLKSAPSPKSYGALEQAVVGRERIIAGDSLAYIYYPDGVGNSRLTNALIDAKLATRGTGRNWNTVLKLNALLAD